MTRKSYPGGAAPYSAALISLSVPSTPTRRTFTSTPRPLGTSFRLGFGNSARCTLQGLPGNTLTAFTVVSPRPCDSAPHAWLRPHGPFFRGQIRRSAARVWLPTRSSRFGGWRQPRRLYRHGSTHGTERDRASGDPAGRLL